MRIPTPAVRFALAATLLAGAGFAFVLDASYPGYLNPDSVSHLKQIEAHSYDDWQSPFPKLLWSMLAGLIPGPAGFIVFTNLLIWGASLGLTFALRARLGRMALLFLLVPLLPGAFNYLGNVHVDALLVAWLLAGVCAAYLARREGTPPAIRRVAQVIANLLLAAAFLTRPNAIFGLVPLMLYANARLGLRRNLAMCAALLVALPVLLKAQNALIGAEPASPTDSIKTYNLLALSHYEQRNLFPGRWTVEQAREIVYGCYSPVQWDTAWSGQCSFIHWQLKEQGLWGSSDLTRRWLREILRHPVSYFNALSANFKLSLFDPNSRAMLYNTPNPWDWAVALDSPRTSTRLAHKYVNSKFNDGLGRPWLFALLSALGIVLLYRTGRAAGEEGRFALAVLSSGLVYLLTYFPFNVSAEYRYFYWSGFACYLGLLLAILSRRSAGTIPAETAGADTGAALARKASLVIAALATALVLFPFQSPVSTRIVTVTPVDGRPVELLSLRNTGTALWMWPFVRGKIDAPGWIPWGQSYRTGPAAGGLVSELKSFRQDVELIFSVGPGMGAVTVESGSFRRYIDTSARAPGIHRIVVPAESAGDAGTGRGRSARNLLMASVLFLFVLPALSRLAAPPPSRAGPGRPTAAMGLWQAVRTHLLGHRLVRFTAVGGVGFAIEAGLLTWFATMPAIGPIFGRGISFPLAVLATWWLNRKLTFRSSNDPRREGARYFLVQILGALANLAVFMALVLAFPVLRPIPVVPLFLAAIVGLAVNFILAKKYVFIPYAER